MLVVFSAAVEGVAPPLLERQFAGLRLGEVARLVLGVHGDLSDAACDLGGHVLLGLADQGHSVDGGCGGH